MRTIEAKDNLPDSETLKRGPEAVLFDMDGLMIDSESLQSQSFEAVLREYGKSPVYNDQGIIQTVGISARDNWALLRERYGVQEEIDVLIKKKRNVYAALLQGSVAPMPGLMDLLGDIKDKPTKKAIVSSSARQHIDIVVTTLAISDCFDSLVSGEEVSQGKPSPGVFLEAAKRLQVRPEGCVVLEDAPNGVEAAKTAGMKVIVVPNQFTINNFFERADEIVSSLRQLSWRAICDVYNRP